MESTIVRQSRQNPVFIVIARLSALLSAEFTSAWPLTQ
jgi:hypothetical protein